MTEISPEPPAAPRLTVARASPIRKVLGIVGFIIGFALALLLETGLFAGAQALSGRHFHPVGLGFIALPIAAGAAGYTGVSNFNGGPRLLRAIGGIARLRLCCAAAACWWLGLIRWLLIAEPYRYRYELRSEDWVFLAKLFLVPPMLVAVAFSVFAWAFPADGEPAKHL